MHRGQKYHKPQLKKRLGQHFLHDSAIAQEIVALLGKEATYEAVIEVGPGAGALTKWLTKALDVPLYLVEVDVDLIPALEATYASERVQVVSADFLQWPLAEEVAGPVALIGNFPYNISSQIFFKVLQHREAIEEVVCMVQHEVAARIAAPPGNKTCGILSILLQAFYEVSYAFSVPPTAFTPPPKVTSGVVRLVRRQERRLGCDEKLFFQVVKSAFQQRRKMLRNALASLGRALDGVPAGLLTQRAEALSVADFVALTNALDASKGDSKAPLGQAE